MSWVATAIVGSAVVGAGVSAYGANKQAKAISSAQDQNAQLQREQNNSAWQGYLMSRGINPMGATAGNIPTGAPAINARLPLWANVNVATGPKVWRRVGSTPQAVAPRILSLATSNQSPVGATATPNPAPANPDWWRGGSPGAYALN